MSPRSNVHLAELETIRDQYRDKRSLGYQLVDALVVTARSAVVEAEAACEARVATVEGYHATTRDLAETLTRRVRQLEDQRVLVEDRVEQGPDAAKVQIRHALNNAQEWTIAELEEIAYRLRTGGGVDETRVKMTDAHATAVVPAPNLVDLGVVMKSTPVITPPPVRCEHCAAKRPAWRVPGFPGVPAPAALIILALGVALLLSGVLGRILGS